MISYLHGKIILKKEKFIIIDGEQEIGKVTEDIVEKILAKV